MGWIQPPSAKRTVRGTLVCGVSIELGVEDGTDRAVGERADLDGAGGGGFQTGDAERPRQPQDAEAGSEAPLGVGPLLQDEVAERGGCRTDAGGVPVDEADGPVGVTAMAGRHVVGGGGVLAVAARSHVHGDPLALDEDLHGAAGEAHPDLAAREAVGNAVELARDFDVVVDADAAHAPFGEDIGFDRQGLEGGPVKLFEELPAGHPEPAKRSLLIELLEQLTDRRIQLGQAIEPSVAQAAIQSPSVCVQVASTWVKFEAPITATKICAWRVSPVSRSTITGTLSPA